MIRSDSGEHLAHHSVEYSLLLLVKFLHCKLHRFSLLLFGVPMVII